jgi:hypothetical protein
MVRKNALRVALTAGSAERIRGERRRRRRAGILSSVCSADGMERQA